MTEHDGRTAAKAARRGLPAWLYFTATGFLTLVLMIAIGVAAGHIHDGGGPEIYAFPLGVAALALLTAALGYRRLPTGPGLFGRPFAIFLLGCVGIVLLAAATGGIGDPSDSEVAFKPWLIAGFIALGLWYSVTVWRNLDEAAREAHKWSVYWGAGAGIFAAMPLFLFEGQSARWRQALGISDTFEQGALLLLIFQLVGYGLAWLIWWARRR